MRVALVKQELDVFGPWRSVRWRDTTPMGLFEYWPGKAVYWELTCMLEADWWVVPQRVEGDYFRDAVAKHAGRAEVMQKHTKNVVKASEIPLEEYDVVITFDPILEPRAGSPALFAYYVQEHWDRVYGASLRRPAAGYDLFLAHMLDADSTAEGVPRSISFPYLHEPRVVRQFFPEPKREEVWVDWRTVMTLAMKGLGDAWDADVDRAAARLQEILSLPMTSRGDYHSQSYGFSDPPRWGDAEKYLEALARCRYYVAVGRVAGAGQGLGDAAAAGCICIGESDKVYHRLICHPQCLCADLVEMPERLKEIQKSRELQEDVIAWQDAALKVHFKDKPLQLLAQAAELKDRKALWVKDLGARQPDGALST